MSYEGMGHRDTSATAVPAMPVEFLERIRKQREAELKGLRPPPPPPRSTDAPSAAELEFMQFTGVSDLVAARVRVSAAAACGEDVKGAVRHYFENGGKPMPPRAAAPAPPPPPPPRADAAAAIVEALVEMGFDRGLAVRAAAAVSTLEEAIEWCLQHQHAPAPTATPASQPNPFDMLPNPFNQFPGGRIAPQQDNPFAQFSAAHAAAQPLIDFASMALFESPKAALAGAAFPSRPPERDDPGEQQRRAFLRECSKMPMGGGPPAICVAATNPHGHAPLSVVAMPPSGILAGADAADQARRTAQGVDHAGKLWKLSGVSSGKSRLGFAGLGNRWQPRHFILGGSRLAYGEIAMEGGLKCHAGEDIMDTMAGTTKRFSVWGSYVTPEPPERAFGREHAFAIYRSDEDVIQGARPASQGAAHAHAEREQLLLLAAEDAPTAAKWMCALAAGAGRAGVLLHVADDASATTYRLVYGGADLGLDAGAVGAHVLVRRADLHGGAGAVGVRVGDEIVGLNNSTMPLIDVATVKRMVAALHRPLELVLRRPRDARAAKEQAERAVLTSMESQGAAERSTARQLRESMDVGEALRADQATRLERDRALAETRRREETELGSALETSAAAARAERDADAAVAAVLRATHCAADGDVRLAALEFGTAAERFGAALDALVSARGVLGDAAGARARDAVQNAFPGLALADLYDHACDGKASAEAQLAQRRADAARADAADAARAEEAAARQRDAANEAAANDGAAAQLHEAPTAEPAPGPARRHAVAIFAYDAAESWQLSVAAGQRFSVVEQHADGWTEVRDPSDAATKLVPSAYLELEPPPDADRIERV
ncbi:hypothetical protein M885DRAFT_624935 [Pelagophyceae sp. CCMP2097]|nr:hypothetical protein M885DRAFT_624935 [Pelagophyceae sp. CCMP2097]